MNFDEWLKQEMDKLDKIRNALKERHGTVDRDYQEWLFEDAKEPWGFVQKGSVTHAVANHTNSNEERGTNGSGRAAAMEFKHFCSMDCAEQWMQEREKGF